LHDEAPTICKTVQTTPVILRPSAKLSQVTMPVKFPRCDVRNQKTAAATRHISWLPWVFPGCPKWLGMLGIFGTSWTREKNAGVARGETQNWGYVVCQAILLNQFPAGKWCNFRRSEISQAQVNTV
jgi:hypothetical protein